MSFLEIIGLALASAAGGAINAVAGGGTLVTFPTLLALGTPPIVANATSTLALTLGTAGSVYGYRRQFASVRMWLTRFVPVSIIGSLLGGWLLTVTSEKTFSRLVPFLILFATVLFFLQGVFKRFAKQHEGDDAHRGVGVAIVFQFGVAVYGGYFGAGIGILMLASLGFIGLSNIFEMNALKTVLAGLINLAAALVFVSQGLIHWPKAAIMTAGAFSGYYLGSHYSQKIPPARVRQLITAIGVLLSLYTFYEEFWKK
jgi:uncharacterized membrane protein YfcA